MNKKKLSVVVAGAMLASSLSPVLAEVVSDNYNEYTVNKSNRGILIRDLRNLLNNNLFTDVEGNDAKDGRAYDYRNESIYYVELAESAAADVKGIYLNSKGFNSVAALEAALQNESKTPAGTKVIVKSRGFQEVNGKKYAYAQSDIEGTQPKYETVSQLETVYTTWKNDGNKVTNYPAVYKMMYKAGVLTVTYRKADGETKLATKDYKVGDEVRDFTVEVDKDGEPVGTDFTLVENFKLASKVGGTAKGADIEDILLADVEISDVDAAYEVALSSLYDGLFLTEDGQKLLDTIKEYKAKRSEGYIANVSTQVEDEANGIFSIRIALVNGKTNDKTEIIVKLNNKAQLDLFRKWMYRAKAQVEVLAGDNRYETAVKVAKENASIKDVAVNGNIVLVNGNALVDGLAAAPLAASVWNKADGESLENDNNTKVAPILLTETNSIPKATKEYIRELVGQQQIQHLDKVTVYLVGGETVVSKATEEALKDEKIDVTRIAGEKRQDTNAKVIEKYYNNNTLKQLVVSKDGKGNKSHLIDALTATSLAVKDKAPIVLATNNLSNTQINALEKKAHRDGVYVYQVGIGVARDVVKTIAERIGLAK